MFARCRWTVRSEIEHPRRDGRGKYASGKEVEHLHLSAGELSGIDDGVWGRVRGRDACAPVIQVLGVTFECDRRGPCHLEHTHLARGEVVIPTEADRVEHADRTVQRGVQPFLWRRGHRASTNTLGCCARPACSRRVRTPTQPLCAPASSAGVRGGYRALAGWPTSSDRSRYWRLLATHEGHSRLAEGDLLDEEVVHRSEVAGEPFSDDVDRLEMIAIASIPSATVSATNIAWR